MLRLWCRCIATQNSPANFMIIYLILCLSHILRNHMAKSGVFWDQWMLYQAHLYSRPVRWQVTYSYS